jgi:hypothetical protein
MVSRGVRRGSSPTTRRRLSVPASHDSHRLGGNQKHLSSILGFMYNAGLEIEGTDEPFIPVERRAIGGAVQVVLDALGTSRLR